MNDKELNLVDEYIDLSEVDLIDPFTVKSNSGVIYPLSTKAAISNINVGSGLRSRTFSNQLYKTDPGIWETLKSKLKVSESVDEYINNNKLIIVDKSVVGVVESTDDFDELLTVINNIKENNLDNEYKIYTNSSSVRVDIIHPEGYGVSINYLLDHNWVTIYSIDFRLRNYVSSYRQVHTKVKGDMRHLLDYEVIMTTAKSVIEESDEFFEVSDKKMMSVNEVKEMLRSDFNIRITTERVSYDDLDIEKDLSNGSIKVLNDILDSIYSNNAKYINSPYLRRSVEFTDISYFKYFTMLSLSPNSVELESLYNVSTIVMKGSTNKDILE